MRSVLSGAKRRIERVYDFGPVGIFLDLVAQESCLPGRPERCLGKPDFARNGSMGNDEVLDRTGVSGQPELLEQGLHVMPE